MEDRGHPRAGLGQAIFSSRFQALRNATSKSATSGKKLACHAVLNVPDPPIWVALLLAQ